MVTLHNIREAAQALGISNRALCIHASLRSFGKVEGGASAVVEGLLAEGCTVMVPTFSWTFAVPPSGARPTQNGWNYDAYAGPTAGIGRVYRPDTVEIDREDMGAIAAAVVARPERTRGNHPLCSFAVVGPLAHALIAGQRPLNVWGPFNALAEADGLVVLMGVALDKMTLLHAAEQMAGRNPFRRWANGPDGQPMQVEVGGCSHGFGSFGPVLSSLESTARVGASAWRVFPAKDALHAAASAIRDNPQLTHCGDPECGRCRDAVLGGPVLTNSRRR
jgi:aminoglycoside N3'-acetyltransferase